AMAIADAARIAPGLPSALYGVDARSVNVWSSLGVVVAWVFVITPILTWVTDKIGLTGTTSIELGHRSWWFVVATGIATVLVAPWLEEVAVRGLLLEGLWARIGFWPAAFTSALIWAALHEVGGVLIVFTGLGVVLAWVRRRTGSVRMGIGLHTLQNTVATALNGGVWIAIPLFVIQAALMFMTRAEGGDGVTLWFRSAVRRVMAWARGVAEVPRRTRAGIA